MNSTIWQFNNSTRVEEAEMSLLDRRVAGEVKPPYDIKERTFEFGVLWNCRIVNCQC